MHWSSVAHLSTICRSCYRYVVHTTSVPISVRFKRGGTRVCMLYQKLVITHTLPQDIKNLEICTSHLKNLSWQMTGTGVVVVTGPSNIMEDWEDACQASEVVSSSGSSGQFFSILSLTLEKRKQALFMKVLWSHANNAREDTHPPSQSSNLKDSDYEKKKVRYFTSLLTFFSSLGTQHNVLCLPREL